MASVLLVNVLKESGVVRNDLATVQGGTEEGYRDADRSGVTCHR